MSAVYAKLVNDPAFMTMHLFSTADLIIIFLQIIILCMNCCWASYRVGYVHGERAGLRQASMAPAIAAPPIVLMITVTVPAAAPVAVPAGIGFSAVGALLDKILE